MKWLRWLLSAGRRRQPAEQAGDCLDVPPDSIPSVALRRIIEEVRSERAGLTVPRAYNRVYSRHNRS